MTGQTGEGGVAAAWQPGRTALTLTADQRGQVEKGGSIFRAWGRWPCLGPWLGTWGWLRFLRQAGRNYYWGRQEVDVSRFGLSSRGRCCAAMIVVMIVKRPGFQPSQARFAGGRLAARGWGMRGPRPRSPQQKLLYRIAKGEATGCEEGRGCQ